MEQAPTEQAPTEQAQVPPTEAAKVPSEYSMRVETLVRDKVPIDFVTLRKRDGPKLIVEIDLVLPFGKIKHAVLERFFVMPRKETGTRKYAGEGKKALCYLMNELVKNKELTAETVIQLEAQASRSPDAAPTEPTKDFDTLVKEFPKAKQYIAPEVRFEAKVVNHKRERVRVEYPRPMVELQKIKARLEVDIPQNRKLVKYYNETYGFKVDPEEDYGDKTKMTGTVGEILKACDPTGAARKKTRRRRRTRRTRRHA